MKPTAPGVHNSIGVLTFVRVERQTPEAVKLQLESGRYVWVPKDKVIGGWTDGMEEGGAIRLPGWMAERL